MAAETTADHQVTKLETRALTEAESARLSAQDSRPVADFRARKFQSESRKHWDLFYKRNKDRFFKDRHWTTREFADLSGLMSDGDAADSFTLLEVGCGVGNFVYPLLEECSDKVRAFACDFSARAVDLVKSNPAYDGDRVQAFVADVRNPIPVPGDVKVDAVSAVFVLSAVPPGDFARVLGNLRNVLKPGGKVLFRDYAVNDMAMVRFGANTKMGDRHYLRQDGTASYFFERSELADLASAAGMDVERCEYVHRRTVNVKEGVDAARVFLQAVLVKNKEQT